MPHNALQAKCYHAMRDFTDLGIAFHSEGPISKHVRRKAGGLQVLARLCRSRARRQH